MQRWIKGVFEMPSFVHPRSAREAIVTYPPTMAVFPSPPREGFPVKKRAPPAAGLKSSSAARGNEAARRETLPDRRQRAVNMVWPSLCVFQGVDQRPVPSGLKVT